MGEERRAQITGATEKAPRDVKWRAALYEPGVVDRPGTGSSSRTVWCL